MNSAMKIMYPEKILHHCREVPGAPGINPRKIPVVKHGKR